MTNARRSGGSTFSAAARLLPEMVEPRGGGVAPFRRLDDGAHLATAPTPCEWVRGPCTDSRPWHPKPRPLAKAAELMHHLAEHHRSFECTRTQRTSSWRRSEVVGLFR